MSRPEIRRLRKFHERHFPHGYFSKFKRLLQTHAIITMRDGDGGGGGGGSNSPSLTSIGSGSAETKATGTTAGGGSSSPSKASNNKHIIPADSISVNKQLGTGEFGIVQQGVWSNGNERVSGIHVFTKRGRKNVSSAMKASKKIYLSISKNRLKKHALFKII